MKTRMPFTHASRPMAAPLWGSLLHVSFDPEALPDGRTAQTLEERETLSQEQAAAAAVAAAVAAVMKTAVVAPAGELLRAADLGRASLSWQAVAAWGYNASVGLVAFVLLVSLLLGAYAASHHTPTFIPTSSSPPPRPSATLRPPCPRLRAPARLHPFLARREPRTTARRQYRKSCKILAAPPLSLRRRSTSTHRYESDSSAEQLRASGMTLDDWWGAVTLAFTWTCFQSFVPRHV